MPSKRTVTIPLLFLLFLGLVASRRWEQLVSPQVWAEDGRFIAGFIQNGWREFLQPISGYLILVPKVITRVSLAASIYYYPMISTLLACLFTASVGLAVAIAPTRLMGRILCAITAFLIPSDPETFGLPLHTLWWAPLLLILIALWDERHPALGWRLAFLVVGGLSSPFIVFVLPVLYFRAFWHRDLRAEKVLAFAGTGIAGIQLHYISNAVAMSFPPVSSFLKYVVPRFCGWFLWGNFSDRSFVLWPLGLLVVAVIAAFLFIRRRSPSAWILGYLYAASIAAATIRLDPAILHPILGGARYFFFPYILTFWILIQLFLAPGPRWLRNSGAILALVAVLNAVPHWSRRHDDLHWAQHVLSARLFSEYDVPIESDGRRSEAWYITEPGGTWEDLMRRDWFVSPEDLATLPTFAYRIVRRNGLNGEPDSEVRNGINFADGRNTISVVHDRSGKTVEIRLPVGGRIRFRSGSVKECQSMQIVGHESEFIPDLPITADWVTLEFSNLRLPQQFTVRIMDLGQGVGEWSTAGTQSR